MELKFNLNTRKRKTEDGQEIEYFEIPDRRTLKYLRLFIEKPFSNQEFIKLVLNSHNTSGFSLINEIHKDLNGKLTKENSSLLIHFIDRMNLSTKMSFTEADKRKLKKILQPISVEEKIEFYDNTLKYLDGVIDYEDVKDEISLIKELNEDFREDLMLLSKKIRRNSVRFTEAELKLVPRLFAAISKNDGFQYHGFDGEVGFFAKIITNKTISRNKELMKEILSDKDFKVRDMLTRSFFKFLSEQNIFSNEELEEILLVKFDEKLITQHGDEEKRAFLRAIYALIGRLINSSTFISISKSGEEDKEKIISSQIEKMEDLSEESLFEIYHDFLDRSHYWWRNSCLFHYIYNF